MKINGCRLLAVLPFVVVGQTAIAGASAEADQIPEIVVTA